MLTTKRVLLILLLFTFLIPSMQAIGISPTSFEIPYKPGEEGTYEYHVRVKEGESDTVRFYSKGDLNDSIDVGDEIKTLPPGQWTKFQFKIKFPTDPIAPGLHENRVGAVEHNAYGGGGVGALAGVEARLLIRVPFEGRYLELKSFEIPPGEVNTPVNFYAKVVNRGKENIDSAVLHLDVMDSQGQMVDKIKSESIPIKRNEEATLNAQWQTGIPGPYIAEGFIVYDDNFLELEQKGFHVGDLLLKIESVSAPQIEKGEITKVYFDVKSLWNAAIEDVYADLVVKNKEGEVVGEEKSQTLTIEPWSKVPVVMYWDSKNQGTGEYEGKITLHYAEKTDEATVIIKIKNPLILSKLKENMVLMVGMTIVLLMLIINVILLIKKKKNKNG